MIDVIPGTIKRGALIAALCCAIALPAPAQRRPEWRDTFESRLAILALLQSLNAEILAASSATRTLEQWCGDHHMAAVPQIVAVRLPDVRKEPSSEQLQRLGVRDPSELQYRRVELRCGAHVLSKADNWYVPARLTPEINALLETTDTPFGKAVQSLRPYRRTVAVTQLWTPLPRGWEQQQRPRCPWHRRRTLAIPNDVFEHRAVLYTAEHLPFSEVVETYQGEVLAFRR
jgi:chorismate-pyruvate lyase